MALAIIGGTGNLGYGLALRLARAGTEIVIGSRSADKAEAAAQAINQATGTGLTRGMTNAQAAAAAEVVVLAVPAAAHAGTLTQVAAHVDGKVVIDTTVCLAEGDPTRVAPPPEGSAAERARDMLPGARVAAALHTISGKLLANLEKPVEGDVLVAGDDAEAKARAMELVAGIGARPIDAGPLDNSQTLERLTALIIGMNIRYRRRHIGLRFTGV